MKQPIYRCHYRGQLLDTYDETAFGEAVAQAESHIKEMIQMNQVMTAALYQYGSMLFFYYEAVEEERQPEELTKTLTPFLKKWPGQTGDRNWAWMYHIYYHAVPQSVEDWKRPVLPQLRRGRIAFLKTEKLFDYVYHHIAIVKEGLLKGDKYQSIGIHENILFSYFEEPRTNVNIRRDPDGVSREIDAWEALDPKSHFIPGPEGTSFTFLPALIAVGQEAAEEKTGTTYPAGQ